MYQRDTAGAESVITCSVSLRPLHLGGKTITLAC
jgi:hypothetical protein